MDLVLAYVDGNDPQWQADYAAFVGGKPLQKRFRDWGTLPYLLRGIQRNLPFIERVFLVVARESQVPAWLDPETVRVVLHRDFIPEEYLPLFNASSLELFLPRIPDLGERFLYFNDDIFPLLPLQEDDFFVDGKPAKGYARQLLACGDFQRLARRADRLACRVAGQRPGLGYYRPQHCCTPLLRSEGLRHLACLEPQLPALVSRIRAAVSGRRLESLLRKPGRKLICINDVEMPERRFRSLRDCLLAAFSRRFPSPSRFERSGDHPEAGAVH